ncbi:hypothetical protein ACLOJK_028584 [Asimina triloba]
MEEERHTPKRVHPSEEEDNLLKEELEASRAEVAWLQSTLWGDVIRSSVVVEHLRRDVYRHRVEFEQAHHSGSGYVKVQSDVAALYPKMDLSSLYRNPFFFPLLVMRMVAHINRFPVVVVYDSWSSLYLAWGSPMWGGFPVWD